MLTILQCLIDEMIQHAKKDFPIEACGVIAGACGSNVPRKSIPMKNEAQSETFFEFNTQEHLKVWREMDSQNEEPIVIYHSHTQSEAYPSRTDRLYASEPNAHYVIISVNDSHAKTPASVRSFRIINQEVIEERINIVASYNDKVA